MGALWSHVGRRREVPASKIAMFLFVHFSLRERDRPAEVPLGIPNGTDMSFPSISDREGPAGRGGQRDALLVSSS
jgi:hypothetical protein